MILFKIYESYLLVSLWYFYFLVKFSFLTEKAMTPHSSTLAWKIPWTEEPGRLQSMGSLRVRHDWATSFLLFTFTFHFHALEKEMATHSSVLAWRIPGTGESGWLPSMGLHRVGHDWSDLAAAAAASWPRLMTGFLRGGNNEKIIITYYNLQSGEVTFIPSCYKYMHTFTMTM